MFRKSGWMLLLAAPTVLIPAAVSAAGSGGDAAAGKAVFAKCMACHTTEAGKNKIGPSLHGVVGRKAGAVAGFAYSPAMKGSGITWTEAELDAFLANPRTKVKGTKMFFAGLPKPEDRANLIAYLETQK